jgi:RecB family endonuclease NucS
MSQIPSPKPKAPAKKRRRPPALGSQPEPSVGLRRQDVVGLLLEQPSLLEPGLEIYREDGKTCGVGYSTDVGEIDLLARDDAGSLVVIHVAEPGHGKELVGELLQRIGWVRRHLGSSEAEVRGIVLLDALPDDLGYAAAAVADTVEFKLYQLQLTFEPVIL